MPFVSEDELRELTYKAGLVDDLQDFFKIDCAYLLVGLLRQDSPMQRALNGECRYRYSPEHRDMYICHPN